MNHFRRSSRQRLHVLLVSTLPPPNGGIERWTFLLLEWLRNRPGQVVHTIDTSTRRWRSLWDMRPWKRVLGGILQGAWDAARIAVQLVIFRPKVLHLSTSAQLRGPWDTLVLMLAAMFRVRSLYHLHLGRLPQIMATKGWEWRGIRWALQLADRVIVLDRESEVAAQGWVGAGKVVRLPNAIELEGLLRHKGSSKGSNVLYLGHVIPTKGMKELMLAWRQLAAPGWCLRVAGPGSATYREELLRLLGDSKSVEFLGDLDPTAAWESMQAADIFVLPTYTEGFPNVILEAMAAGKAIISTPVGAVPEMLDAEGQAPCGLVVKPRDATALAAALQRLISDPELRETLGRRGQFRVKKLYGTDVVFCRLTNLWHELVGVAPGVASPRQCEACL